MTLFLDDGDVRLYHGDALEQLRELPDGCVDMVATSPPFYGLRDYGTGEWEGGDPDCDHSTPRSRGDDIRPDQKQGTNAGSRPNDQRECKRCGARRVDRQIGLEETPDQWVTSLVAVFRECRRVLADHGTLWVEIGDSYVHNNTTRRDQAEYEREMERDEGKYDSTFTGRSLLRRDRAAMGVVDGCKVKDLLGQPWLLAFALRADGWYLRSEIIWARPNPMPESVTDRPTKSHSTVFMLSKRPRYFYDADAIREAGMGYGRGTDPTGRMWNRVGNGQKDAEHLAGAKGHSYEGGANARTVWTIPTQPTPFAHFATWPQKLVARMIQAGTSDRGKCPECGKPWVREVELGDRPPNAYAGRYQHNLKETGKRQDIDSLPRGDYIARPVLYSGWSPSCGCAGAFPPAPVPCTVLDPFAGSGTTLLVARHHGRHAIGIELNPDYCQIAAEQLQQLSLLT